VLQESLDHLKRSGFEVERTTTGYAFTLGPKSEVIDLYIGKEECEVIQNVGKNIRDKDIGWNQASYYCFTSCYRNRLNR
jgi:hypothetical protein